MRLIYLTLFLLLSTASASASGIFACATTDKDWHGQVTLDDLGTAALVGSKGSEKFSCSLSVKDFRFFKKSHVTQNLLRLDLGECQSTNPLKSKKFLLKTLVLTMDSSTSRKAKLDWVTYLPSSNCSISIFDKQALKLDQEKWDRGVWGR